MLPACGQIDKGGQIAIGVESDMKLRRALGFLVLGPREQGLGQVKQGGIQLIDLPVQLELGARDWQRVEKAPHRAHGADYRCSAPGLPDLTP